MLGGYLLLLAITAMPPVQRWLAGVAAGMLEERIGTRVVVRRVRMGLPGRIIVDGLQIFDRRDTLMLHVPRVAAKVDITPLLDHRIRIGNAQLFGARAVLYHAAPDSAGNWQFLADAFTNPSDTTHTAIDLRIGSLLVRRCQVRYDRLYVPRTRGRLDANHLSLTDLSLTARLGCLTPDSLNVHVKKMSGREQSGLELTRLRFRLVANRTSLSLADLDMQMPHTSLSLPLLTATYSGLPAKGEPLGQWLSQVEARTQVTMDVWPADLADLCPSLARMEGTTSLAANVVLEPGGRLSVTDLQASALDGAAVLKADIMATDVTEAPSCTAYMRELTTTHSLWARLPGLLPTQATQVAERLQPLGEIRASGMAHYSKRLSRADLSLHTAVGDVQLKGSLTDGDAYEASVRMSDARPDAFVQAASSALPTGISATAQLSGRLHGADGRPAVQASGHVQALTLRQHTYHDIPFEGSIEGHDYHLALQVSEEQGQLSLEAQASLPPSGNRQVVFTGNMEQFSPSALHLTQALPGESLTAHVEANVALPAGGQPEGEVHLLGLTLDSEEKGRLDVGDILLSSHAESGLQHLSLRSEVAQLDASGAFRWQSLPRAVLMLTHQHLPSVIPAPHMQGEADDVDMEWNLRMRDTAVVARLTGVSLSLPEEAVLHGSMHSGVGIMELDGQIPQLCLGQERLLDGSLRLECTQRNVQASMHTRRMMKGTPVDIDLAAYTENDRLATQVTWAGNTRPSQKGALSLGAQFLKDPDGKTTVSARVNPSDIIISDTVWHVHPGTVYWHQGCAHLQDVSLSSGDRYFALNGKVSAQDADTLTVDVKDFDLAYLFNIVNFHAVDFHGLATGRVYGRSLTSRPVADAYLQVHDFTFNDASMGDMDIHINWGARPKTIQLDAYMQDARVHQQTAVQGSITLGHGPGSGLDLDIETRRMDLHFLHRYASSIFSRMEGRVTGNCHVFGPFKNINLEGKVLAEEASVRVSSLGVDYHLAGDSVILVPDTIRFPRATIYDYLGSPGSTEHVARLSGELTHHHLSQMSYDIKVEADNILGYNFPQMEDLNFCGTVYASGTAHVYGQPGMVNIDVKATPQSGTTLVYDASSPATVTNASFITYVSHADSLAAEAKTAAQEAPAISSDLRLNFDLDITPEATMQVLMDAKSGDYINLYGNGRILADYYNKGKFQMYGTYRVDHGLYKLSLQDVIRKDFTFRPDGTVTFGGDPGKAALQLTAVYTVPNVSLDDLSSSSLGLSNTRVDCVMNIGGEAFAPAISFDFDLPNANEDEKRMVRSMLSTDEERNMQVIYLLGIGRFYNQNAQMQNASSQGGTAMNSLISSTLSSQFNQFLSNAMGTHNWSFGANLRTGETGWDQLDIEGILSGRLLNNRLLINGNFGYRESYYSTNNFIGDFDVQYLLTPGGNLSLKAYNQTNDRYFIQSSLTTQGIGLQFKRDFNSWRYLFRRLRKSKPAQGTSTPSSSEEP